MQRKAKRGKYKTLDSFVADFNLMIRNCMTFNPDTTIFYKEGKRIGKRGNELIERHATSLRGEPQRIRTKKRRKTATGPTSEALSMLTSSGVVTIKDFGDVDQSGMIPEGMCDELLADVALILSDPLVKQLICDALMKKLVVCWQKRELPTDNLICRALVQLLQIGNPSSVRRMIRKQDFVLRAPQVVTMRVVLPLLLRTMVGFRVYYAFPVGLQRDLKAKAKEDVLGAMLWDNVLRASSAIRAMAKSFAVQCLVDHQIDAGVQLLHRLVSAEDESLLRDRVLLHAVAEVLLEQVKTVAASSSNTTGNDGGSSSAENGEVTMTLGEQLQALAVWKQVFDNFFVDVLSKRIQAAKKMTGSVVHFADGEIDAIDEENEGETSTKKRKRQHVVKSFPTPIFHEKAAMVLSSLFSVIEKGGAGAGADAMTTSYLRKTLGVLRECSSSLEAFEALWSSPVFAGCRLFYEPLLSKCPAVHNELFVVLPSDAKAETTDKQLKIIAGVKVEVATSNTKLKADTSAGKAEDAVMPSKTEGTCVKTEDSNGSVGKVESTESIMKTEATADAAESEDPTTVKSGAANLAADIGTTNSHTEGVNANAKGDIADVPSSEQEESNGNGAKGDHAETDAESVSTGVEANEEATDNDVKMADVEAKPCSTESEHSASDAGPEPLGEVSPEATTEVNTNNKSSAEVMMSDEAVRTENGTDEDVNRDETQKAVAKMCKEEPKEEDMESQAGSAEEKKEEAES
ncbi:hypothetical protein ON010_g12388 [Phytophthora cinnamomi]|nr:hypothetical protein ON010_g12388 [Phytophthora cinnamomi]